MAQRAFKACVQCGRAHQERGPRCKACKPVSAPVIYRKPLKRESAAKRGYGRPWQKAAKAFLAEEENHICKLCGCAIATQVDHIIPHRGDPVLFWDRNNWQGACRPCHSRKTRRGQ